jgi:Cu/Ag efflux pump CusA
LIKDTTDIGNIVLKSTNGTPTYLKDAAAIKVGEAVRQGAAMSNGASEAVDKNFRTKPRRYKSNLSLCLGVLVRDDL